MATFSDCILESNTFQKSSEEVYTLIISLREALVFFVVVVTRLLYILGVGGEILNRVYKSLLKQNCPLSKSTGLCIYTELCLHGV